MNIIGATITLATLDCFVIGCIWASCFIPCLIYHIVDVIKTKRAEKATRKGE